MRNTSFFQFSTGTENNSGNNYSEQNERNDPRYTSTETKDTPPKKSFLEKVKEALRDWSNKDEQDRQYDDRHV